LQKELQIIDQMHFNDYFLVVQDYVAFAKRNGILVGPGRGSVAGSLVAYVLGITEIDPIQHDLIFERFLNPSRQTMPDIDIDFMDNRRNEIIEYLFERYGTQHVAHIITFQRMKAKMAVRDVGRILGIELPIINNISKLISMQYDLDLVGAIDKNKQLASFAAKYETLFDIAKKILNFPRQIGLHAAGVVITDTRIDDILPVQSATDGINCTQFSMEYLEPIGLIKMDILGLVNLTTINETIKLIKKQQSKNIDLSQINLNDARVFNELTSGHTIGIFQLESPGMQNLIMKIKPKSIEDISITSALFRPGPQKNIPTYLKNKTNPNSIQYLNDDFKEVLSSTYNIIIYQEQVIEIVQRVAGFSLADADLFRRAISKKNADKLSQLKEQFIHGGKKNKYSETELNKIFDFIYEFANYGFNHSHSLAYSYISY
jgi:DNA polymerase-3 subunit alpha